MDTVPPIDPDIGRCKTGVVLDEFKVGQALGKGNIGTVFALLDADTLTPTGAVLKVLAKSKMTHLKGLVRLNNQLHVLGYLTEMWKHPNVVQLHAVFHSATNVLIQMQDAGPDDLAKRLSQRNATTEAQHRILCARKSASALSQCLKAVCHLHIGPGVSHRGMRPESFLLSETDNDIHLCLTDFDLALIVDHRSVCKGIVGIYPYMAPEMLLRKRYSPFAADVWSVGVVCLEVLCGIGILQNALNLPAPSDIEARERASQRIVNHFERPESAHTFVTECTMPKLRRQFEASHELFDGLLNVDARRRWKAKRIIQELEMHKDFLHSQASNQPTRVSIFG